MLYISSQVVFTVYRKNMLMLRLVQNAADTEKKCYFIRLISSYIT